ncbi:pyrroline-5-carboxylate reductase family protein [Gaoshiqia sediminis]|uniref:NAD(P)-binding domain-containing protein n=1 Tax=Gaoshiqia sediminis TaxID=2986998 RepID=A0AA41YBK6_9BACT|nr:NAD(P)-binding domain-containing protein [Gaoshiqia sediminis]MCW0483203.1 NAD(P)-binding domain-containing protein [Gaoshiqia sediminis]
MKAKSLGFIGGGCVTQIFLQAFANKKHEFDSVVVFDTDPGVLQALKQQFPAIQAGDLQQAASQPTVFIALHPPMVMETLDKMADVVSADALVVSLAPKITLEKISSKLKTKNKARMIPNATSYINEGYNPVTFSTGFNQAEKSELMDLLKLLGTTFEVPEAKLEAYAMLSAMLPTYFWFQWKELVSLGEPMGLSEEETKAAVRQTLQDALDLYFDHGLSPEKVMDLIPVKPIGEHEAQIAEIYQTKLMGLFGKIKP